MSSIDDDRYKKINTLRNEVDSTKDVMSKNIQQIIVRGEKVDDLIDRTNELEKQSTIFRRSTRTLRRNLCMKNYKLIGIGILIFLVILLILYLLIKK
jgi:vesicle-associated membrane protein 7